MDASVSARVYLSLGVPSDRALSKSASAWRNCALRSETLCRAEARRRGGLNQIDCFRWNVSENLSHLPIGLVPARLMRLELGLGLPVRRRLLSKLVKSPEGKEVPPAAVAAEK